VVGFNGLFTPETQRFCVKPTGPHQPEMKK